MGLFGYELTRSQPTSLNLQEKAIQLQPLSGRGGWWSVIREPFMGAWQRNEEVNMDTVLTYFAVYSCVRLISTDIGKLTLQLVEQDEDGIWTETDSPAFSPVLREPNRYQTINKFVEQWILSKLIHGNSYALKARDGRGIVTAMYVLDPTRVTPMVASDGAVYYELKRDDISGLKSETVIVPASEILHDTMVCLYHPLVGVSPIYASGVAAMQGLSIQSQSTTFFANRSTPNGILTAPVGITDDQAAELKAGWKAIAAGDIAVLAGDLKYQALSMTAVESQLIEQLKMTAEQVCSTFGVPPYLVDIGPPPPYANFEPLVLKYHSQCIQSLTTNFEKVLDKGLGLTQKVDGRQLGTYFDIDDLIWMDNATRVTSAQGAINSGSVSPNEARKKYFGLGRTPGGETPYMQQQNWPLRQLAAREPPTAATLSSAPVQDADAEDDDMDEAASLASLLAKGLALHV